MCSSSRKASIISIERVSAFAKSVSALIPRNLQFGVSPSARSALMRRVWCVCQAARPYTCSAGLHAATFAGSGIPRTSSACTRCCPVLSKNFTVYILDASSISSSIATRKCSVPGHRARTSVFFSRGNTLGERQSAHFLSSYTALNWSLEARPQVTPSTFPSSQFLIHDHGLTSTLIEKVKSTSAFFSALNPVHVRMFLSRSPFSHCS